MQPDATLAQQEDSQTQVWQARGFRALRILVPLLAAAILLQAISAGQILSGNTAMRALHSAGMLLVLLLAILQLVAAILVWRPGRGPGRMVGSSIGLIVAIIVQAALGAAHVRGLHIPLGVLIFGGVFAQMAQLRSRSPGQATGVRP
ncbi:hypothetical protein [Actinopolymorpha alba]|uniref:hypothetical protein n=1 Tax=Actinopolymorpha alba TaxID=533267 RepID=UPI000382D6E7|nr:hypothetical protein [Actinopolymorpha alba]